MKKRLQNQTHHTSVRKQEAKLTEIQNAKKNNTMHLKEMSSNTGTPGLLVILCHETKISCNVHSS